MAITLEAVVQSIVYRNPETDWSVLRVQINAGEDAVVTGHTAARPGQGVRALGDWKKDKQGRVNFESSQIAAFNPNTPEGVEAFLGSGVIKGLGPATAKRIVGEFGADALRVLSEEPESIKKITGIGKRKAERIIQGWADHQGLSGIMAFLHSQGLPSGLCRRIFKAYGSEAVAAIKGDPYKLTEIRGIGFKVADSIGLKMGVSKNNPRRLDAGILYALQDLNNAGHCGEHKDQFLQRCIGLLEAEVDPVKLAMARAEQPSGSYPAVIHRDGAILYSGWLAKKEQFIAKRLLSLARAAPRFPDQSPKVEAALRDAMQARGGSLTDTQKEAVRMILTRRIGVLTGGPGCGKTHTLNVALAALTALGLTVSLAAPTGKAAQRASEATGRQASTLHRLLGLRGPGAAAQPVAANVLVVDESSMVDVPMMAEICAAVIGGTSLVLVGDIDQLPSVGPGSVLGEVMRSGVVPVVRLTEVFRQAAGSLIIQNAHAINAGVFPRSGGRGDDFFVMTGKNMASIAQAESEKDDAVRPSAISGAVAQSIVDLVSRRLPAAYGFDPITDIQVLCPANTGISGVKAMNEALQMALNPAPSSKVMRFGVRYGMADKVIQIRNNYDLNIFNGDVGIIIGIDTENEIVRLDFQGRHVEIEFDDLEDLRLAYAMTIHKSQGSQARAVVIPMVTQHWMMLQRNLLYTGVTRARELAIVVGSERAISRAVRHNPSSERQTLLGQMLIEGAEPGKERSQGSMEQQDDLELRFSPG
jgi:exodeoxyribonuclease V alpha subunit